MIGNPLINDCIEKETRGKATMMQMVGYFLGEMFSMAVLFNLTKDMAPLISFSITSCTIFVVGIILILFTKETKPDIRASIVEQSDY